MIRRLLSALAAGLFALGLAVATAPAALAQQPYTVINPPIPTDSPSGKIEVVEFFWYECPHCYELEPVLEKWVAKLPEDVEFRRVPATFNERWNISARVFYALEAMGLLAKLHKPLFDAIHKDRLKVTDERQLNDWLQRQGVDAAKFQATYKSFAVESRLKRTQQLVGASKIDGVPALMVNGRYLVAAGGAVGTHERMVAIADSLIAESRKSLAAAGKK
jgi:thiol:disulfide interchange protein DsbA